MKDSLWLYVRLTGPLPSPIFSLQDGIMAGHLTRRCEDGTSFGLPKHLEPFKLGGRERFALFSQARRLSWWGTRLRG